MNVYECSSINSNKCLSQMYLFVIDAKLHSATVLVSLRGAIMENRVRKQGHVSQWKVCSKMTSTAICVQTVDYYSDERSVTT